MPVLVPTVVVTPPPVVPPSPFPHTPDPGRPVITWIHSGIEWPLTSPSAGWHTLDGVTGWGAAPVQITTKPRPRGGGRVQHIQPQIRYLSWPLRVHAETHLELVRLWRLISAAFTQTSRRGPGILRVARPDGTAREIEAYYQKGFEGEPGQGHTYDTAPLMLLCEDAYWRDIEDHEPIIREYVGGSPVDYQDPYPSVSSGQSLDGAFTIVNPGQVEAWPVWTITGPMTSLIAENNTTGEAFTLTTTLVDSTETITIDADGDEPSVIGPDGVTSLFGSLNKPGAVLWGLAEGTNDIEFTMAGAGAGSKISLTWRNRWETS